MMAKFVIGVVLLWLTLKLAHYLRSIASPVNRPNLFRNPLAFSLLNIFMIVLPILGLWFLLAGIFGFRAPLAIG
jgi:hypothetical protein